MRDHTDLPAPNYLNSTGPCFKYAPPIKPRLRERYVR